MIESGHTQCLDYPISIYFTRMQAHNTLAEKQEKVIDGPGEKTGNILREGDGKLTPEQYEKNWLKLGGFLNGCH